MQIFLIYINFTIKEIIEMKRKTNLFYTVGSDSNFITFSNYTESLTGSFLSTETKLFPSAFICFYAPSLNDSNRKELISFLAAAYENKLAFLRDKLNEKNQNVESWMKPGAWLIEYLYKYFNNAIEPVYCGQVTEQDYNGVFADTIMIIDSNVWNRPVMNFHKESFSNIESYDGSKEYLYNWYLTSHGREIFCGPADTYNLKPIFDGTSADGTPFYNYSSKMGAIEVEEVHTSGDIKFNIVLPLYDVVNMSDTTDAYAINQAKDMGLDHMTATNKVPLGLWFSGNEPVVLNRRSSSYSPSWSLSLSSQFKPFPYSKSEVTDIDQTAKNEAFMTYAQIMVNQNKIMDRIEKFNTLLLNVNRRLYELEARVNNIASVTSIDEIKKDIASMKAQLISI